LPQLLQPPELISVPPDTIALLPVKLIEFGPVSLLAIEQLLRLITVLPPIFSPDFLASTQALLLGFIIATADSLMLGLAPKNSLENIRGGVRVMTALTELGEPVFAVNDPVL
jgi:hypothetical protein